MTVRELAERLGGTVEGDGRTVVTGIASLDAAGAGDVSFVMDARRAARLETSRASAVIVGPDCPAGPMPLVRVGNVQAAVAALLADLAGPESLPAPGVHPSAVVANGVELGDGAAVGPNVVIEAGARIGPGVRLCAGAHVGAGVQIGEGTVLYPGTAVQHCRIGRRCRIGPNAVIGSSGFGYYFAEGRHNPIPHAGAVEIGDDVDIGACSCVDRAKFDATRIGDGTKIDNLVQIAHNVQIGRGCVLAALVGIAGTSILKDGVILGGHVGVRDNVVVGAGVMVAACSAVFQDVPDGMQVAGTPAAEAHARYRTWNTLDQLPEMRRTVRDLAKRLEALESAADDQAAR